MANELYLVAFDGMHTGVVDFATACAKRASADLHIVHVLEWSPFAFLTAEEIEQRHSERQKELDRAQTEVIQPVLDQVASVGVTATSDVRFGAAVSILCDIAIKKNAEMMFAGRTGNVPLKQRVFGSVAIGLAQASPVPIVIVP